METTYTHLAIKIIRAGLENSGFGVGEMKRHFIFSYS
jgi:hypothetical protein